MQTKAARKTAAETSARIRERVERATRIQRERFAKLFGESPDFANARLEGSRLEAVCALAPAPMGLLNECAEKMGVSARGYTRILKAARTVADLEGAQDIEKTHIAQALAYRRISPRKNL